MTTLPAGVADVLDAYLQALKAGNEPTREALFARHPDLADELSAALDGLEYAHRAARSLAGSESGNAILSSRTLGDYRLLREIGRGGMAVVYEAEQMSLERRVALKVLPLASVLDPKQLRRFHNEALAAAHLNHPHIVPVYGVGCDRGIHYYAMQYIEGQSLDRAVRDMKEGRKGDGPATPISSHGSNREPAYIRMIAALGMQAAEALHHAHHLGVVHRDVKPANLLLDGAGTLWVTDFGLAHTLRDAGLTMTGELLGTIRYMSPEQAHPKPTVFDHRTDVYSLGATLYELLTLEPAFPGDDPQAVLRDLATKEPVPPRSLNPSLPRDLETVLLKAMSKEPAARYATAQDIADDLGRYLADRPVHARRRGLASRAVRWSRRHRMPLAFASVLLALALGGLWAYGDSQDAHRRKLAEEYRNRSRTHAEAGNHARAIDAAQTALRFDPSDADAHYWLGVSTAAYGSVLDAIVAYRAAIALDPDHARAHHLLGCAIEASGDYDLALVHFRKAVDLLPKDASARFNLGHGFIDKGLYDEALPHLQRAEAAEWVATAARRSKLAGMLDRLRSGALQARDAAERIDFAEVLLANCFYSEAAQQFATAFRDDPALAAFAKGYKLDALRTTALAGSSMTREGSDWRAVALRELRAELAARRGSRGWVMQATTWWKCDRAYSLMRDRIDDLPPHERAPWQRFWADVEAAQRKARR